MPTETNRPSTPSDARSGLHVLVVGDDPHFADGLAELLRHMGHAVRTVGNGLDAVAAVVAQRDDVIFLDVRLPGLTGYDLARWVKRSGGEKPPYLIAVSGSESDADRQLAAEIGIDQLQKPLDPKRLDDLLARAGR